MTDNIIVKEGEGTTLAFDEGFYLILELDEEGDLMLMEKGLPC